MTAQLAAYFAKNLNSTDQKIARLKAGESIEISRSGDVYVTAERSGDGKYLRMVRHTATGFEVISKTSF